MDVGENEYNENEVKRVKDLLQDYTAVLSEKGVSFKAIKNFHFEKNKKMYFGVFLKQYLRCIALNHMKFYTLNKSFIIYLMI